MFNNALFVFFVLFLVFAETEVDLIINRFEKFWVLNFALQDGLKFDVHTKILILAEQLVSLKFKKLSVSLCLFMSILNVSGEFRLNF